MKKADKGSVLAFIVIFMGAFVIMATVMYKQVRTRIYSAVYYSKNVQALYISEAGLQDALQQLKDNPSWTTGFSNKSFGKGNYTVTVDTGVSPVSIVSISSVHDMRVSGDNINRSIVAEVQISNGSGNEVFNNGLNTVTGNITLSNSAIITGKVNSGNKLTLNDSASIIGDAEAQDKIKINGGSISGTQLPYSPNSYTYPSLTENTYKNEALVGGTYSGNMTISSGNTSLGPKYITGKLTIKNSAIVTLTGTVFVENNIILQNSAQLKGSYTVYAGKNVTLKNSAVLGTDGVNLFVAQRSNKTISIKNTALVYDVLIYAPGSNVTLTNNSISSGSIVAKKITVKKSAKLTWEDISVIAPSELDAGGTEVTISSWNETW